MRKSTKPTSTPVQRGAMASNDAMTATMLVLIDLEGGTMRRYVGRKFIFPHYVANSGRLPNLGSRAVRKFLENFRRNGA